MCFTKKNLLLNIQMTTPLSVSSATCNVWLDGSDATTMFTDAAGTTQVSANGASIECWKDKANNKLFKRVDSYGIPTYTTSGLNSKSVVSFNGTNQLLTSTQAVSLYASASSGASFYVVFKTTNNSSQRFLMYYPNQYSNQECEKSTELGYSTGLGNVGNFGLHRGCSDATVSLNVITTNTAYVMGYILDTTGNQPTNSHIYKNGTSQTLTNQTGGYSGNAYFYNAGSYPASNNTFGLTVGARDMNGTNYWDVPDCFHSGIIAELICYSGPLNTTDRQTIEGYLGQKWGITLSFTAPTAAPTIGTATKASSTSVSVTFTGVSAGNNGGSAITGYTVTSSPGGFTGTGAASPIVVSGLTAGTAYTFTVVATNAAGNSSASSASNSVTPAGVPGAPTITGVTPANASASIAFTAPASNGGASISGYTVTSSPGGFTGTGAASPITVSGLTNGTAYTFTMTATNSEGTGSASSASSSITPYTTPPVPTSVAASQAAGGTITVSWTDPSNTSGAAIQKHTITWTGGAGGSLDVSGAGVTSSVVTGLTNNTAYTFTVTSYNGSTSAASSSASLTPRGSSVAGSITGTPVGNVALNSTTALDISGYTANTFQWQSSATESGTYTDIAGATSHAYTVTNSVAGTKWYRCNVQNYVRTAAPTAAISIVTVAASVAGSIGRSGSGNLAYGNNSTTLTLTGNTGTIQWQSSTDDTNFTNISGATNTTYAPSNLTATTYYRVNVTNSPNAAAISTSIGLTVDAATAISSISASATEIGYDMSGTTVTVAGTFTTVQWQSSSNNSSWSDILNATSATYTTGSLTATKYYRAVVQNGVSASTTSTVATITVDGQSISGEVVATFQRVGYGESTELSVNGETGTIYWQSSADNVSWADISGATGEPYVLVSNTVSKYYRARIQNGMSSAVYATGIYITVDAASVAGSITASTNPITYNSTTTLTLSGELGTIQWQTSSNGSSWTNISGATSRSYTTPGLTANTYYQAVVTNSESDPATTSIVVNVNGKGNSSISVTGSTSFAYDGSAQGPASVSVTGSQGAITYAYSGPSYSSSATRPTAVGSYTVVATVAEDTNYLGASSSSYSFSIVKATSSVDVSGSTSFTYGDDVVVPDFSKTGSTGEVTYMYSGTGSTTYGPSATAPSVAGTYSVTASLASNTNYTSATKTTSFTIGKANSTVDISGSISFTYDESRQKPDIVQTGSSGAVTFGFGGVSGTVYSDALPPIYPGNYTMTVSIAADDNYNSIIEGGFTFEIVKAESTIELSSQTNWTYDNTPHGPSVDTTGSTGSITYDFSGANYHSTTTPPTLPGTYYFNATLASDSNYNGVSLGSTPFIINKQTSTIAVVGLRQFQYDSQPHQPSVSTTGSSGDIVYTFKGVSATSYGPSSEAPTASGSYSMSAVLGGDELHYSAVLNAKKFTIGKGFTLIAISGELSYSANGSPQGPNVAGVIGNTNSPTFSYEGRDDTTYGPSSTQPDLCGNYIVSVSVDADANYLSAYKLMFFSIIPANVEPEPELERFALILSAVGNNEPTFSLDLTNLVTDDPVLTLPTDMVVDISEISDGTTPLSLEFSGSTDGASMDISGLPVGFIVAAGINDSEDGTFLTVNFINPITGDIPTTPVTLIITMPRHQGEPSVNIFLIKSDGTLNPAPVVALAASMDPANRDFVLLDFVPQSTYIAVAGDAVIFSPNTAAIEQNVEITPIVFTGNIIGATIFSVIDLPAGLSMDSSSGTITGTPTAPDPTGFATITIEDSDGNQYIGTYEFTLGSGGGGGGGGGGVPCFVKGTRILTASGYKAIEKLNEDDKLITSDNRQISFRLVSTTIPVTNMTTAPYVIPTNTFGRNTPCVPLYVSPTHKLMFKKGVWTDAQTAAEKHKGVRQFGVGQSIIYYHILCDDYLRDNVIAEGTIAESLGTKKYLGGKKTIYTWSERFGGYTRVGAGSLSTLALVP